MLATAEPISAPALMALEAASGIELRSFRQEHVSERVRRAIVREATGDVAGLVRLLHKDPAARVRFRRSVAISVSGFFRDPDQFRLLARELLPPLLEAGGRVDVWSAGSSDGSELYSVAVLVERAGALERASFLGSDLLEENVRTAKEAIAYGDVPLAAELAARLRFEQRDIVREGAPAGRWNLVLCRNVAIYLTPPARDALYATVAGAVHPGGVLLLGRSERIAEPAALGLVRAGRNAYRKLL